MNSSDLGGSIVGPQGLARLKRKYKSGGKVKPNIKSRREATAIALSGKRARLQQKYGSGGTVMRAGVVSAPIDKGSSWWQQLQSELQGMAQNQSKVNGQ